MIELTEWKHFTVWQSKWQKTYYLNKPIKEWLEDRNLKYDLEVRLSGFLNLKNTVLISLSNPEYELLFKLACM